MGMFRGGRVGVVAVGLVVVAAAACTPAPVAATWSPWPPPAEEHVSDVDCPTPTSCWAISAGALTRGDGTSWVPAAVPTAPEGEQWNFVAISCPEAATCFIGGARSSGGASQPLLLRWDGTAATDIPVTVPAMDRINNLSCVAVTWCMLRLRQGSYGGNGALVVWNGATTTPTAVPAGFALDMSRFGISCGAPTNCMNVATITTGAAAGRGGFLHWNGSAWTFNTIVSTAGGVTEVKDVACAGPAFCTGTGLDGISSGRTSIRLDTIFGTWSPSGWTVFSPVGAPLVGDRQGAVFPACSSPQWCLGVGARAENLPAAYAWAGRGWTSAPAPDSSGAYAATCARTERWCLVYGNGACHRADARLALTGLGEAIPRVMVPAARPRGPPAPHRLARAGTTSETGTSRRVSLRRSTSSTSPRSRPRPTTTIVGTPISSASVSLTPGDERLRSSRSTRRPAASASAARSSATCDGGRRSCPPRTRWTSAGATSAGHTRPLASWLTSATPPRPATRRCRRSPWWARPAGRRGRARRGRGLRRTCGRAGRCGRSRRPGPAPAGRRSAGRRRRRARRRRRSTPSGSKSRPATRSIDVAALLVGAADPARAGDDRGGRPGSGCRPAWRCPARQGRCSPAPARGAP